MSTKDFYSDEHNIEILRDNLNISTGNLNSVVITSTLNATSESTGSLITAGGIGVGKDLYIGGNLFCSGNVIAPGSGLFEVYRDVSPWLVSFDNARSTSDSNVLKLDFSNQITPSSSDSENNWLGFYFGSTEYGRIKPQTSSGSDLGIEISGSDIVDISADSEINLNSHSLNIDLGTDSSAKFRVGIGGGFTYLEMNPSHLSGDPALKVVGNNSSDTIVEMENSNTGSNTDILKLVLNNTSLPGHSNNWLKLYNGANLKGGIRGAEYPPSGYEGAFVSLALDGSISNQTININAGYAQFYSGGSDFGEWFEIGDESEWPKNYSLPEGIVVYVNNKKIYRTKPGVPFVVTGRALLVGNYIDSGKKGAILSFVGQVPVVIEGKCSVGDFVVPKDNSAYAISPDKILFNEYINVLGTCIQDKNEDAPAHIMVAIGKK